MQRTGYWYDYPEHFPRMNAELRRTGMRVERTENKLPWLVVYAAIESVIVPSDGWPGGRLWRARVATPGDMSGVRPDAGYWRASAIELIEEIPRARLFGAHGEQVIALAEQISTLTVAQADTLLAHQNKDAWAAYARAWSRWNAKLEHPWQRSDDDWTWIMDASDPQPFGDKDPQVDKKRSPIHRGFEVISFLIEDRARSLEGEDALIAASDEEIDLGLDMIPRWLAVRAAFLQAAMALGAPQYVAAQDRAALLSAYNSMQLQK